MKLRICIIGGGNLGMALAAEIGHNCDHYVILLTSKYKLFNNEIESIDIEKNTTLKSKIDLVTNNYDIALNNVDIIFITVPAFAIKNVIDKLILNKRTIIVLVPGSGGREFHLKELINNDHIVVGFDRVPFIARIKEEGKTVIVSKKDKIRMAYLSNNQDNVILKLLSKLLNIEISIITKYLNIIFTPSNQILHTTRIFSIFHNRQKKDTFPKQIKFYSEWDDLSSFLLIKADDEIQNICKKLKLKEVVSIMDHYESYNVYEMTNKIRNITSLSNIDAPLIKVKNKFYIDCNSRYFIEDFPFGLCIVKDFADIAHVNTPTIDIILRWFMDFFGYQYFLNNLYIGKDLLNLSLPRNIGLRTIADINNYYK